MARRRFFVDEVQDGRAFIRGDAAHHLARVLRVEAGQKFEITNGDKAWLATVASVHKNLVEFGTDEELPAPPALPDVTLLLALIKFENFEWAVEKATELGVTRIVPVEAARSERGMAEGARKRAERWRRIARDASEQSRRQREPLIADPAALGTALNEPAARRFWFDEQPGAPLFATALAGVAKGSTALLIGPEGGWTPAERSLFASSGWQPASLGPAILRTETATCAALAVLTQFA